MTPMTMAHQTLMSRTVTVCTRQPPVERRARRRLRAEWIACAYLLCRPYAGPRKAVQSVPRGRTSATPSAETLASLVAPTGVVNLEVAGSASRRSLSLSVARSRSAAPLMRRATSASNLVLHAFRFDSDSPLNACGVFVQLRSPTGATARAYADGDSCRAHGDGFYAATVVVPDGGVSGIEFGLSGTSDVFFPLWESAAGQRGVSRRN